VGINTDPGRRTRRWLGCLLLLASLGGGAARAQSGGEIEGAVVSLDAGELVVDLGSARGLSDGDVVELWRPVKLRHPVTGKTLVDRFRIGSLRLVQVRKTLALAAVVDTPTRPPATGDVVVFRVARAAVPAAPVKGTAPSSSGSAPARLPPGRVSPPGPAPSASAPDFVEMPPEAAPDPEERELTALFDSLRGTDPVVRIQRYEDLVVRRPRGRFSVVLYEEAQSLRRLFAPGGAPAAAGAPETIGKLHFEAPDELLAGRPLRLAVELKGPATGAVAHVRSASDVAYVSLPLKAVGAGYWSVEVPGQLIAAPSLVYFIEATDKDGAAIPVVGTSEHPRTAVVLEVPRATAPRPYAATAALWTDYASYNTKAANDHVFQTEGYFGVRLGDEGLRALRSGFGVFRGVGGTLHELDELHLPGRSVGLTYGYLETEVAPFSSLGFIGRAVIGLREDGVSGGGQLFVRIGNDRKTNLLLGGEFLGGIGLRGITQLEWNTLPRIPIVIRTEVTNQPAGVALSPSVIPIKTDTTGTAQTSAEGQGEVGARVILQVGYRITPELVVAARASYQGRTINHAGPGGGAAVTYEW
jgi:hypothetical protein